MCAQTLEVSFGTIHTECHHQRFVFGIASGSFYLVVAQLEPGLLPVGEDLPQDDSETPHIALRGELPVHDALRWHPANG